MRSKTLHAGRRSAFSVGWACLRWRCVTGIQKAPAAVAKERKAINLLLYTKAPDQRNDLQVTESIVGLDT